MELVKEFERKYWREEEKVRWQEAKEDRKAFSKELPRRYTIMNCFLSLSQYLFYFYFYFYLIMLYSWISK